MHENVLQSIGNRQQQYRHHYGNNSSLEDIYPRKSSAVVQPMPTRQSILTPEKENQPVKPISVSPVLPGTGSVTHNITRMLEEIPTKAQPSTPDHVSSFAPYNTAHFLSFRHKLLQGQGDISKSSFGEEATIDVENVGKEYMRTCDLPDTSNSSISTQGSDSPQSDGTRSSPSGSTNSSPGSGCGSVTSPEVTDSQPAKKKARTNYTADQIQTLLKVFHENPYPDSEMMETIGNDLGIPENKIKIWFQNKRARWRRRVNDNVNNSLPPHFMPMSPMMSPVTPYGFFQPGQLMTSPSPQGVPGYFNYQWMQGSMNPNGNQTSGFNSSRLQPQIQNVSQNRQLSPPSLQSLAPSSSAYAMKTSPQPMLSSTQNSKPLQYPSFLYPSPYSNYGQLQQ